MANEMRDRLVELLLNGEKQFFDTKANRTTPLQSYLANHLIENGVIVPPCKVGETLWLIQIDYMGEYSLSSCLVSSKITMFSILRAYEEGTVLYMSTDKSQAEQKLKEMQT